MSIWYWGTALVTVSVYNSVTVLCALLSGSVLLYFSSKQSDFKGGKTAKFSVTVIFCFCFKTGVQKMRPCAFMMFSLQICCGVKWSASDAKKLIKDCGHQGKDVHLRGQSKNYRSVSMSRVLLEYAYFPCFICFQWTTY